jgi:hypothetical protein
MHVSVRAGLVAGALVQASAFFLGCSTSTSGLMGNDDSTLPPDSHDGSSPPTNNPVVDGSVPDATAPDQTVDAGRDASDRADADASDAANDTGPTVEVDGGEDAATDAAADAAEDAMIDAAPDAPTGLPPVGSPCSPVDSIQSEACGLCGFHERLCARDPSGGFVWQDWGFCQGEVVNGCNPNETTQEDCGLCGKRAKECQSDCTWAVGACLGQPAEACRPETIEYKPGLSCPIGSGRSRTCQATCTWGDYGECEVPGGGDGGTPIGFAISRTLNGEVSQVFHLGEPRIDRFSYFESTDGACVTDPGDTTVNKYVVVSNPTAKTATVSVWLSAAPGGTEFDSIMASYAGATNPPTSREMCVRFNDDCYAAPCPGSTLSGLIDGSRPVIPPNSSIVLYLAAYSTFLGEQDVTLNLRTDLLQ